MSDPKFAVQLLARQAIRELKARYFRFMDERNWHGMRAVFTADAAMDMRCEMQRLVLAGLPVKEEEGLIQGREAIIAAMSHALAGTITVHHGHMPEIEIVSDHVARGIWAMEDIIRNATSGRHLHGYGHYHEQYVRDDEGHWRIESLRLTRLHVEVS